MSAAAIPRDGTAVLQDLRSGARSAVDVVAESLGALAGYGTELNLVVTSLDDSARVAAIDSDRRYADGTARALEGLPVGVKDIVAVGGVRLTAGSRVLDGHVSRADADVVARLRAAGAIPVATLATFAFANGDPVNVDFGVTRNPADALRLAGGSSSGSAAAVGSGCVPLALGSDTGGSIRLPAAYCGVVGHKPTKGRVSTNGVLPLSWTLDHIGPFARSVRDTRLALGVLSGDTLAPPQVCEPSTLRVGVPDTYFLNFLDPQTAEGFHSALDMMTVAGARVVEVHVPNLELTEPVGRTIITAEAASLHEAFADRADRYDDLFGARLAAADQVLATDYLKALRLRELIRRALAAAFDDCDVVATPTTPTVAPLVETLTVEVGGRETPWLDVAARNTFPFNLSGMPAVSVPVPVSGLPVGLQLAGPRGEDALVLDVAEWFESLTR